MPTPEDRNSVNRLHLPEKRLGQTVPSRTGLTRNGYEWTNNMGEIGLTQGRRAVGYGRYVTIQLLQGIHTKAPLR
jgi:hypothetical protein